jgi:hypothetical protein
VVLADFGFGEGAVEGGFLEGPVGGGGPEEVGEAGGELVEI